MKKNKFSLFCYGILLVLLVICSGSYALEKPAGQYDVLNKNKPLYTGRKPLVKEFFSFYCQRSYILNASWSSLIESVGHPVTHINMPVKLGPDEKHWANLAFLVAKQYGKGDQFKRAMFRANFVQKKNLNNKSTILEVAASFGLRKQIARALKNKNSVAQRQYKRIRIEQKRRRIVVTPTIFINNNIRVTPEHSEKNTNRMVENLEEILVDLARPR